MNKLILITVLLAFTALSCKKTDEPAGDLAPTDLTINAIVSNDNSGNVSFTATATNAVVYLFNFGNNATAVSVTGALNYQYLASGVYTVSVIAKSSTGKSVSTTTMVTIQVIADVVWSEEFDTPGQPNSLKWGYDIGAGGWGNNEQQYYTNRIDNAVVSDGTLKIILKKESYEGSSYTSARILTKGKYSFQYGKIAVRAKLPAGGGTWPAIWMLGDNISAVSWPACGEIDIMEHVGNQLNKIHGTLHHPGHSGGNGDGSTVMISNVTTEFHIYSLEWSPASVKFFVDDVLFYTFTNTAQLPFNQKFFIILNVAMGGNFGGAIDPNFTSGAMEIDYVRVYQ